MPRQRRPGHEGIALPLEQLAQQSRGGFKANYLDPASTHPAKWPAATTPLFKESWPGAEELETDHLIPAFKRFNESRVNALLLREDATGNRLLTDGRLTLTSANRLLRSLFVPTEVNLLSSGTRPGSTRSGRRPTSSPTKTSGCPRTSSSTPV